MKSFQINQKSEFVNKFHYKHTKGADKYVYRCVLCGYKTSLSGSISNRGSKLICNDCAKENFKSIIEAFMWLEEAEGKR